MSSGAVIIGKAVGLTVIVLETESRVLPQVSIAVHVSVTFPPQEFGAVEKVDGFDISFIKHVPFNSLLNEMVLGKGRPPQATVMSSGAVIIGKAAGLTEITLVVVISLP